MQCKWYTQSSKIIEAEIEKATLPGGISSFSILENHAPIIGALKPGKIYIKTRTHEIYKNISKGFFKFNKNNLLIISDITS